MASLPKHNPRVQAAQSKLAIAQFIGNRNMWAQAMASMKDIHNSAKHVEDNMFCGRINSLSALNVRDIFLNYDTYGDLISVDADLLTAQYKINTEVSF
ncbi:Bacteriophage lambda Kil protein [Raoultella ornithinolytica]|uniref:host cell division inhibitory peptide Kil n=1 Tax=Raoultella ornithinolytica TaxID=54291 RepID=UPI0007CCBC2B|nr:host cell division inhibitory peptide Kil [Raoultella ornithinolytica]EMD1843099.1 host cell division inhibitory peptide Kil [Raoultella planticola]SBL37980.1 Bacteriophage lambda Kil protein [Raoultella ornithinolytica]HAU5005070.1 host cell division inhibitory peptide Kil [Raoultella ornithinolytica]HCT8712051.1 host cell division inhibitory peptide Kil [Raoultella ornithinolytica]HCT9406817.1 host cell division inhibitory peptide Kil [Raoultella ornithinolytica]